MATARILGTGSYLPDHTVTNDDLSQIVDTSDEWIRTRTGICSRHIAKGETTADMAAEAARRALSFSGMQAEELDMILVATVSPNKAMPNTACQVQAKIGADKAVCFDLNAACSGFLFALSTAAAYIQAGVYQNILVIGAEALSTLVDWKDRGTCILFGDGAGAAVVTAEEDGVIDQLSGSDGKKGPVLNCDTGSTISMNGQEVFKFAVSKVPEIVNALLEKNQMSAEDVDFYILHQANKRIIDSVSRRLKQPEEKFPMNLDSCGNTSGASIPILLDELNRSGKLLRGQTLVLSGFGAGLTWGAILMKW
ncbi:MAG: beta-ketoacyl-ACP synthase III [Lachnospiraceae bacterium]|nr:beta-ketoacyl-ACP synthase III [Lachnospiraceae bacterium]